MTIRRTNARTHYRRRGFTLVELLVVLFIVGLLSAATLPVLIPTLNQRQVQDGSRVVQQALINARFAAMSSGRPAGIRLLPDPALNGPDSNDPLRPLAYNRLLLLEPAADYSDGQLRVHSQGASEQEILDFFLACISTGANWRQMLIGTPPNALVSKGPQDPFQNMIFPAVGPNLPIFRDPRIVLRQYKSETVSGVPSPVEPTSWSWNVRAGDRIIVGTQNVSQYVIAGPVAPLSVGGGYDPATFNPERFVNLGPPSNMLNLQLPTYYQQPLNRPALYYPSEILYVVNDGSRMFDGVDNNNDGVIDPAFDGRDNDGNGYIDDPCELFYHSSLDPQVHVVQPLVAAGASRESILQAMRTTFEWDASTISIGKPDATNSASIAQEYTIKRRMVPAANAAEVGLPADVVIDATTAVGWVADQTNPNGGYLVLAPPNVNYVASLTTAERSRLPIDLLTRYVDIVFQPDGQVVTSAASSVNGAPFQVPFYHLWLTDRGDVFSPTVPVGANRDEYLPRLPMPKGYLVSAVHRQWVPDPDTSDSYIPFQDAEWQLKNERRLITIQTRTGRISSSSIEFFDPTDQNLPFQDAQKGIAEVGQ